MPENILITGATGFVGAAVARRLARRREIWQLGSVVVAGASAEPESDDAGANRWPGIVRLALRTSNARLPSGVEPVVVGEFSATTDWRAALQGVRYVVHLAARVHMIRDTAADPLTEYRRVNVDATLNLARQAAASGVKRLVFLSSIKVNGEATAAGLAFSEDDAPAQIHAVLDPYGQSKLEAEQGLRAIGRQTGLEVVIIRPPLVYGPGVKANFAALVRAVARGIPLPLGAVQNKRSLIGLDNLVDFVITCITHPAAANEVFLVSDGEDLTTPELIRRIGAALGRPARLIPIPGWMLVTGATVIGKRDVARRLLDSLRVDSSKARTLLGWTPPVSIDEGLRRAVAPLRRDGRA